MDGRDGNAEKFASARLRACSAPRYGLRYETPLGGSVSTVKQILLSERSVSILPLRLSAMQHQCNTIDGDRSRDSA